MPTFLPVPFSFKNKITSCLEYIRPIDAKHSGYSLLPHNPLPQPNFAVITFNITVPSHFCGSELQSMDDKNLSHYLK